jgi:hypothetical protein
MTLSVSTRQKIRQIRSKYKDQITKKPSFATDDAVIECAVEKLYEDLKH